MSLVIAASAVTPSYNAFLPQLQSTNAFQMNAADRRRLQNREAQRRRRKKKSEVMETTGLVGHPQQVTGQLGPDDQNAEVADMMMQPYDSAAYGIHGSAYDNTLTSSSKFPSSESGGGYTVFPDGQQVPTVRSPLGSPQRFHDWLDTDAQESLWSTSQSQSTSPALQETPAASLLASLQDPDHDAEVNLPRPEALKWYDSAVPGEVAGKHDRYAGVPIQDYEPDESSDEYCTSLHIAAKGGHDRMVSLLLSSGASVTDLDGKGNTPLHIAVLYQRLSVLRLLLKNGADPNAVNECGYSPVHVAVHTGSVDAVQALVSHGGNLHKKVRKPG